MAEVDRDTSSNDVTLRSSLIVRVKRKRNVDPSETICIIEDSEPDQKKSLSSNYLAKTFEKLNHNSEDKDSNAVLSQNKINNLTGQKFVILKRVKTVDVPSNGDRAKINMEELLATTKSSKSSVTENHNDDFTSSSSSTTKSGGVFFYANKKSIVHSSSLSQKFLVVDMTQVQMNQKSSSSYPTLTAAINGNANNKVSATKTRVLDPATRRLNGAILIADKSGDFNGVVLAMGTGASINHRTSDETGGLTALMAAAKQCNLRMIKRLLAYCVDVLICNAHNETALDIARKAVVTQDMISTKMEIQQWLYRAALKQQKIRSSNKHSQSQTSYSTQASGVQQQVEMNDGNEVDMDNSMVPSESADYVNDENNNDNNNNIIDEETYVYDIFHTSSSSSSSSQHTMSSPKESNGSNSINSHNMEQTTSALSEIESYSGPVVPVEGLRITEGDGVELVFEYDSDWSALAGADDDSDSNAENHPGNDYPEEEEEDSDDEDDDNKDSGSQIDDNDDDDDDNDENNHISYNRYHDSDSDDDDDDDGVANTRKGKIAIKANRTRVPRFHPCNVAANIMKAEAAAVAIATAQKSRQSNKVKGRIQRQYISDDDDDDDDGAAYPDFSFRGGGVGRVLRPHILGIEDDGANGIAGGHNRNTAQLQRIWGEEVNESDDYDDDDNDESARKKSSHRRIKDMRQRTGMNFASSPREFDSNGLARYGAILEDDEDDLAVLHSLRMTEKERKILVDSSSTTAITATATAISLKPVILSDGRQHAHGVSLIPYTSSSKDNIMITDKPSLSTIAYDSELDRMSDD